jgi:hypothetical protein
MQRIIKKRIGILIIEYGEIYVRDVVSHERFHTDSKHIGRLKHLNLVTFMPSDDTHTNGKRWALDIEKHNEVAGGVPRINI